MSRENPGRDRSHVENSRQLQWDRRCEAPGWEAAFHHLVDLLESPEGRKRARRSADRNRLRSTLGTIALDLYVASAAEPRRWRAYSRTRNDYGAGN